MLKNKKLPSRRLKPGISIVGTAKVVSFSLGAILLVVIIYLAVVAIADGQQYDIKLDDMLAQTTGSQQHQVAPL